MMSYRFKRRSFLQGVGGALGLKTMLRNMEASAQGAKSPARLLVTHWPVGIVRTGFAPTSGNTGSTILKPFGDAGLSPDMTVFMGFNIDYGGPGGGHEAGTVKMMTGRATPGTRGGEPEGDDAFSGGASFDQVMLKNAAGLKPPGGGKGYANSICDSRVDFLETSTQCLSYDYSTSSVSVASGAGPEHTPLLPVLSPVQQWMNLFSGFMPGGGTGTGGSSGGGGGNGGSGSDAMLRALRCRKSVLDYALNELTTLKGLAPAGEGGKIDIHADAIRKVELQLQTQITNSTSGGGGAGGSSGSTSGTCTKPGQPADVKGKTGSKNDYTSMPTAATDDATTHAMVGQLHFSILQAAMVCDIIRVGTFQWSPGTNHVSFKGLHPRGADQIWMHHPTSHLIGTGDTTASTLGEHAKFLQNVQIWYYTQTAALLKGMKGTLDGMGGNLFDNTAIPFVTEVQATGHEWDNMAAMMFGGKALGFNHGSYKTVNGPLNNLWATVAQGFGLTSTSAGYSAEVFAKATPISGLWTKPA